MLTAAQIEYACVRHPLPQVDGNEYEARNNEPREISESGTTKSGPYIVLRRSAKPEEFQIGQVGSSQERSTMYERVSASLRRVTDVLKTLE